MNDKIETWKDRLQKSIVTGITVLDFETATERRDSACQLGLVRVEREQIVEKRVWLIKPPEDRFTFTYLHGIDAAMVADAPTFERVWRELATYVAGQVLAAHNACFDLGVLRATLAFYGLKTPSFTHIDSLYVARQVWPRPMVADHKLNTLAQYLGLTLNHHDAASDAEACAGILLSAVRAKM